MKFEARKRAQRIEAQSASANWLKKRSYTSGRIILDYLGTAQASKSEVRNFLGAPDRSANNKWVYHFNQDGWARIVTIYFSPDGSLISTGHGGSSGPR